MLFQRINYQTYYQDIGISRDCVCVLKIVFVNLPVWRKKHIWYHLLATTAIHNDKLIGCQLVLPCLSTFERHLIDVLVKMHLRQFSNICSSYDLWWYCFLILLCFGRTEGWFNVSIQHHWINVFQAVQGDSPIHHLRWCHDAWPWMPSMGGVGGGGKFVGETPSLPRTSMMSMCSRSNAKTLTLLYLNVMGCGRCKCTSIPVRRIKTHMNQLPSLSITKPEIRSFMIIIKI